VVKIEQVGHEDYMRSVAALFGVRYDDLARRWQYASLNRGKRSIALDVTHRDGAEVFRRLVAEADVFITNAREEWLRKVGADWETLRGVNPRLVYGRGGGFGFGGPLAADPCQDTVGMAYGGFMDVTSRDGVPNYPPGSMSDVLTGTNLASAVLAGLVRRSLTGEGLVVGTTQVQSLLWLQNQPVGLAATTGKRMARYDPSKPPNPIFNVYATSDGWIAIAGINRKHWPAVARVMGLEHLLDDERFATFEGLLHNSLAAWELLAEVFATRSTAEWWTALRDGGVWTAPVRRVEDLGDDEHVLANEYLVQFPDGTTGPPRPFDVGDWRGARTVAAEYGEHTDEVLAGLGFGDDEITALRVGGAIW
jgi:formyl-CoA transferase